MKHLKKALPLFLLTLALILCITSLLPKVQAAEYNDFLYEIDDDYAIITGYSGSKDDISIPAKINNYPVKVIALFAFEETDITRVTIPDSVVLIEAFAFSSCENLGIVNLGNGVQTIEYGAFSFCPLLSEIQLPASVTTIEANAFGSCPKLQTIKVDANNPTFSSDALGVLFNKNKTTLIQFPSYYDRTYTVPSTVTHIGAQAFYMCNLTGIVLPKGLKEIGESAFDSCDSLTEITLPDGLTTIGDRAFGNCYCIDRITIPASVSHIGDSVFAFCSSLISIQVDAKNPYYSSDNCGVLFNKNKTKLIQAPTAISEAYQIPNGVTEIGPYAFAFCSDLSQITLPNTLKTIGEYAFSDSSLTSVVIPDSVTSIGEAAFEFCFELEQVTIGKNVATIGGGAFEYCDKLKTVYYNGSEAQWKKISIGENNNKLLQINKVFLGDGSGDSDTVVGDLNNDATVNNDDVVVLLWHTLFPDENPITSTGDIDKDGKVNNNDVVHLLWHTLFPEDFPL